MQKLLKNNRFTSDRNKIKFIRFTKFMIHIVSGGLVLVFGYLEFKDLNPQKILIPSAADVIWKAILVIYYWCWVFGVHFDTNYQELAYVKFPGKGKWPGKAVAALVLFAGMAAALFLAQGDIVYFSITLTVFFIVDHAAWYWVVRKVMEEATVESKTQYKKESAHYEIQIADTVYQQIMGNWKDQRFYAGGILICMIDLFALSGTVRNTITAGISNFVTWLSPAEISTMTYIMLVLLFVAVMEIWHWARRLVTLVSVLTLERLEKNYRLVPAGKRPG